ncbi:hypothetical protein BST81_15025 [Leptolyngbya sp. 'hensonii']|nr:hypothetical protein BST81_15025 [Leptolyngbya sp. 'hensonii']
MTTLKKTGTVAALLAIALTTTQCSNNQTKLQLRLEEGKSYNFRFSSDQKISQTLMGQQQSVNQFVAMGYSFKVLDVDKDGVMTVQVTYDSVQFKQSGATGTIEYDSTKDAKSTNPLTLGFSALVGKSFSMKIRPDGGVQDIQGADALINDMIKALKIPEGPLKDALMGNMKDQFGDQALKEMMERSLNIYPTQPVKVGDSWQKKVTMTKGFPIIMDTTWTLKELKNGVATVEVVSKLAPNSAAPPIRLEPMEMSYNLTGSQQGTLQLNQQTGFVNQAKLNQNISGQMEMKGIPGTTKSVTVPMQIESLITLEEARK